MQRNRFYKTQKRRFATWEAAFLCVLSVLFLSSLTRLNAQPMSGWVESFETPGMSWKPLYQKNGVQVIQQARTTEFPHSGKQSEKIVLNFSTSGSLFNGYVRKERDSSGYAFLGHYVDYPLLVNETAPTLWVRSAGGTVTLGVLVVLPNTLRPDNQKPLTLLLDGTTSNGEDDWEELKFKKPLQKELEETVQAIRYEHKIAVNIDDAYIRQVVLFVEKKRGNCQICIDDLRIAEHASRPLEFLQMEERDASFDPINLLAFRYKVTGSTIALESAQGDAQQFPEEPFGIGVPYSSIRSAPSPTRAGAVSELENETVKNSFSLSDPGDGDRSSSIKPTRYESTTDSSFQTIYSSPMNDALPSHLSREIMPTSEAMIISGSGTRNQTAEYPDPFPMNSDETFPEVHFSQNKLIVGNKKPIAIRAIEYQGEPFAFLKGLQFNAIWLKTAPTSQQLKDARDLQLWLISPPPVGEQTVGTGSGTPQELENGVLPYFNRVSVSSDYDPVLAWDLGHHRTESEYDLVCRSASLIRTLDSRRRPIFCSVDSGLMTYADVGGGVDLILVTRSPELTSLDSLDYGGWLKKYQQLGTQGFPFWNMIQTQPDRSLLAQCRFFGAVDEIPGMVSFDQIRQQVRLSLAAGMHGLIFSSDSPLDGLDHESQYRAAALELMNLELSMIEAWFASGNPETAVESEDQGIGAVVLATDRTSLLMPISAEPNAQLTFGQAAANNKSFTIPVRDGYSAHLLLPGNMHRIPSRRRAGGAHLELEEISMNTLIFLAQSDWYTRVTIENIQKLGKRMSELAIRLARMQIDLYRTTLGQLETLSDRGGIPTVERRTLLPLQEQDTVLKQACAAISQAQEYYEKEDYSQAYLQAERSTREIRLNARQFRLLATRYDICQPVLPVSVSFDTLPSYIENYAKITSGRVKILPDTRLIGGNMEEADEWTRGGWLRNESAVAGVTTRLSRSGNAAASGAYGLLFSLGSTLNEPQVELPNPPLWVDVAFPVKTGELICVEGKIRIPQTLTGGTDGFMIYEDHGGIALAQRYKEKTDWRPFAFYRYAAWDGDMRLTFALSAFGEVYIDDVAVRVVTP